MLCTQVKGVVQMFVKTSCCSQLWLSCLPDKILFSKQTRYMVEEDGFLNVHVVDTSFKSIDGFYE